MDEKLNIQDLAALLAEHNGMEKGKADDFVREFFTLIEDALAKDKYVKIKGLGVFKLIGVEPRESVNIQTKERFEIPGYTKISFAPEASLKDTINQPFALFETVLLNENTVFEEKKETPAEPFANLEAQDENEETPFEPDVASKLITESPKEVRQQLKPLRCSHTPRRCSRALLGVALAIGLLVLSALFIVIFVYV